MFVYSSRSRHTSFELVTGGQTFALPILCGAFLSTGIAALLLSQITALFQFYLLFCLARMNFAGPFDLGVYGAVNNWFVTGRRLASAITTAGHTIGLMVMPLIVAWAIAGGSVFGLDRKSTYELQSLMRISYAVFCLKKKKKM